MRTKILTVDDSKTVRIIVRKAFKNHDCEILEAANGLEGLALAAKAMPDLILLDVTMPVMDGVEMLSKLKADPKLKGIPVMMLTAEGGRDHVLKIAKIGVRDYIVKPFAENVLVEKAGRIIQLTSLAEVATKARSLTDPATILVVDDKPAIVQQITDGLQHTSWTVLNVATQAEAISFCGQTPPDLVIVSLSLPEESAFELFRLLRANAKTKYVPVFGLVVKTDHSTLQQAQTVGFTAVITKPIDAVELEARIAKAMNLDTSGRYYGLEEGCFIMKLPENCSLSILAEIATYLRPKLTEAVDAGHTKAIINIQPLKSLHMGVIKQLVEAMQLCKEAGLSFVLVGNKQLMAECKGFEETRNWTFHETMDEAKASFSKAAQLAPA